MATQCRTRAGLVFQPKLVVDFDGGELTSGAGLLLIREFDARLGLSQSTAECVEDRPHASYVRHPLGEVLRQRLYQIIAGYEDANDATALPRDPTTQVVAGCGPGTELSSQPTLLGLQDAVDWAWVFSACRSNGWSGTDCARSARTRRW